VLALVGLDARAEPAHERDEPIHFDYAAAPECPPADQVLRQLAAYTTHWTLARPDEHARRFVLRIVRRDAAYVGHFDIRDAAGETAGRDIEGESCEDAALGLAVAVALALDPHGSLVPATPEPSPIVEPPPSLPVPVKDGPATSRTGVVGRAARTTSSRPRGAVSVGARAEANGAVSGVLGVVDVFVELEWIGALARIPALRPALRAGVRHAFSRSTHVGTTRSAIGWNAGYVELCPARFALGPRVAIEGCLGADLGQLSAEALDIPGAGVTRRPWLDYGGVFGARWQLHPHFFLDGMAAMWAPLTRDRLRVEPDGVVTKAPAAGFSMGLGGGWRF